MSNFEQAKSLFMSGLSNFQRGDYLAAEDNFRESLRNLPDRVSTMTNLASTLIKLNKPDEAKELCRKAISIDEYSAEAWLNLGLVDKAQSDLAAAAEKFKRAIDINPDYAEAHKYLKLVLTDLDRTEFASAESLFLSGLSNYQSGDYHTAEEQFRESLAKLPDEISVLTNLAATLIKLNRLDEAKELCQKAISIDEGSEQAWMNLGIIDKERSDFTSAQEKFRKAIDINPDNVKAHNNMGLILKEQSNHAAAAEEFRHAIEINRNFDEAHNNLGLVLRRMDQLDDALVSFRKALAINPDSADAHRNIGSLLMTLGKMDEAEISLAKAIELVPDDARILATALLYLPYYENDSRFNQLEGVYAKRESLPLDERVSLDFAMGKAMEHVGQYDRSFIAYAEGNRVCHQEHPFDGAKADRFLEKLCSLYTSDLLQQYASIADSLSVSQGKRIPIFIVGMPRSGTTLIEQILCSHQKIFGAGELSTVSELACEAEGCLNMADNNSALSAMRAVGQKYIDRVWKLAPDVHYIIDKMPGNYDNLGLIHLMLPQAKVIHVMRDPMDTCFSCYATRFERGHEYSYDLENLGRHYLRYRKVMEHWHTVLPPDRILDVSYETVVAATEKETRRILEYLGLPWDPACLDFHKNKRAVKTASVSQVRKPIYTSSMARWKRFKKHLSPLMQILQSEDSGGTH